MAWISQPGVVVLIAIVAIMIVALIVIARLRAGSDDRLGGSVAAPLPDERFARAEQLARDGRTIEAIRVLRQATGLDLRRSRDRVAAFQQGAIASLRTDLPATATEPPSDAADRIVRLLRQGKKIEAIKLARQMDGSGLKEAKDRVDAIERGLQRIE